MTLYSAYLLQKTARCSVVLGSDVYGSYIVGVASCVNMASFHCLSFYKVS